MFEFDSLFNIVFICYDVSVIERNINAFKNMAYECIDYRERINNREKRE